MRAVTKAAVLLLAQSLVCESMTAGPIRRVSATETIPTAYVSLTVALKEAGSRDIPLRLDLVEADEACSPAQLSVNGNHLTQDANGFGQGSLSLSEDTIITANWTFACHSLKQVLTMHVLTVDGKPTARTSFTTNFYQTTPVQITSVENVADVRYLHLHTTVTQSIADKGDEHVQIKGGDHYDGPQAPALLIDEGNEDHEKHVDNEDKDNINLDYEISQLKNLRAQARELAALIKDKESILAKMIDNKAADEPAPTPLKECRDVRCVFKAVAYKIRHGHQELCEEAHGWRALFGCAQGQQSSVDDEEDAFEVPDAQILEWAESSEWYDEGDSYVEYEEYMAQRYLESSRISMLVLVAETAFIVGAAVFGITTLARRLFGCRRQRCSRRRRRQPSSSSYGGLPLYQDVCYFDEPKTLLATGRFDGLCEEEAATKHCYYTDEKAGTVDEDEGSVAGEFFQLREAASVVSDLVVVDAVHGDDDEAPPAYERAADGRRHHL